MIWAILKFGKKSIVKLFMSVMWALSLPQSPRKKRRMQSVLSKGFQQYQQQTQRIFSQGINIRISKLKYASLLAEIILMIVGFLYRFFIFIQMSILGYNEVRRIKKYTSLILQSSLKKTINEI